jgi:hypothetical protein
MIALIPHHLPRLIGFSPASRVDMEGFYQQAALGAGSQIAQGSQRQLLGGADSYSRAAERIASNSARRKLLGPGSVEQGGQQGSMDTTLRATTESGNIDQDP